MTSHFDITLSPEPGSLQRLLGVVRRRGFTIRSISATRETSGHSYHLDLIVDGQRCPTNLRHHLANLADVRTVNMLTRMQRSACA